ncbi:MAG: hypothetical protein IPK50_18365 [Fibrobacterota bacterium]|nr:hypothetical protein [Fibrobacterota bacterium]QQS04235.1 MAG: hypothetical protein IPK50_18365 [Fibrobacterota bacterium]
MRNTLPFVLAASALAVAQSPRAVMGWGLETSSADGPSRAMGEAGAALRTDRSWDPQLEARSAFASLTAFEVQVAPGLVTIEDDKTQNTVGTAALPRVSLSIPMGRFGHLGLGYWQRFQRSLDFMSADSSVGISGEGGAFQADLGYSYAIPWARGLALGATYHRVLGSDRILRNEDFRAADEATTLKLRDTTRHKYWGDSWTSSVYFTKATFDVGVWMDFAGDVEVTSARGATFQQFPGEVTRSVTPPQSMGTAIGWRFQDRHALVGSFQTTSWDGVVPGSSREFEGGLGWQREGSPDRFDEYWRRLSYRAGAMGGFGGPGEVVTIAGTTGLGMPLGNAGTLDLSLQVGQNDVDNGGPSLKETFVRLYVTVTGASSWGKSFRTRR